MCEVKFKKVILRKKSGIKCLYQSFMVYNKDKNVHIYAVRREKLLEREREMRKRDKKEREML